MARDSQLRGWKEIAGFLGTSEKTARRWEVERRLPVHRQQGGGRDLVFASPEELTIWRLADPADPDTTVGAAAPPGARGSEGADGPANARDGVTSPPPRNRRRLLAMAGSLALLGLAVGSAWMMGWLGRAPSQPRLDPSRRDPAPTAHAEPAPVLLPFVRLELSTPGGWTGTVSVADGGAAQFGPSGSHPGVILRPRVGKGVLMLEIDRVDGRPVKDAGARSQPFVLVLDPDVTVQVPQPFPFFVRWVSGDSSPN